MKLSGFYTLVGEEAGKRAALDRYIPTAVRRAISFIEKNYDLNYMREVDRVTLASRVVTLGPLYKKLVAVRGVTVGDDTTECYRDVPRVAQGRIRSTELNSDPCGYTIWGNTLTFDGFRGDAPGSVVDLFSVKYTDLDCLTPGDEHPLVSYYEGALMGQTMLNLFPYANEPEWQGTYGALWKMHQDVLVAAQDEFDYAGSTESWQMRET